MSHNRLYLKHYKPPQTLQKILLIGIILLAFFLRFYNLTTVPNGFFADEASIGYNAYSLLTTGKDEYHVSFPIFFQSFGDYRPPLSIYTAIPFVAIFGLQEISLRLPSVFFGLLTIIFIYLIGNEIDSHKSKKLGLFAAFIAVTMPWLIHYNRTGFEFSIYAAFFSISVLLFFKSIHNKSFIIPAFILSAMTFYTYQPAKLLIPLLLLGIICIYKKIYLEHKKETFIGLLFFLILSTPLIINIFHGEGFARFNMISVFSAKLTFEESMLRIVNNYFIQLSPMYFIEGEPTFITRHFKEGLTPLLMTTIPFLLIGIISIFLTAKNNKSSRILLYWLILYPIAGSLTAEAPFTSRSIIGAPLFAILIGIGITTSITYMNKFISSQALTILILFIIVLNTAVFINFYFNQYPLYSSNFWGWQYGPKQIMQYFLVHKNEYDDLFMSGEFNGPNIFLNFYDPLNTCQSKCRIGDPFRNKEIYDPKRKQLFSLSPEFINQSPFRNKFQTLKYIYYPDHTVAFKIGRIVQ